MAVGPLARLWAPAKRVFPWRRELGIWFGLTAATHVVIILAGWVHWDLTHLFFGYREHLQAWVFEANPFGLGNLVGVVGLAYTTVLVATSNDWAVRWLGPQWKQVQQGSHTLVVLVLLHAAFFVFWYGPSGHFNWFRIPVLLMAGGLPVLHLLALLRALGAGRAEQTAGQVRAEERRSAQ
jgi:methionine sulfoxide reductase heme-binding subunit